MHYPAKKNTSYTLNTLFMRGGYFEEFIHKMSCSTLLCATEVASYVVLMPSVRNIKVSSHINNEKNNSIKFKLSVSELLTCIVNKANLTATEGAITVLCSGCSQLRG